MLDLLVRAGERVRSVDCLKFKANQRSMSLARGRPFSVPITRSLKDCDNWPHSDLADPQDGPLVSMAVLRRDLVRNYSSIL
jgi:hypothetical protein